MINTIQIIVLAMAFYFTSCGSNETVSSQDVNEDKIHGTYRVHHYASKDTTKFYSQFRLGGDSGTTISLTEPSKIEANDQYMVERSGNEAFFNLTGTFYRRELHGIYPEDFNDDETFSFTWTRSDSTKTTQTIPVPKPVSISLKETTYDWHSNPVDTFSVPFKADKLGPNESIDCCLELTRPGVEDRSLGAYEISNGACHFQLSLVDDIRLYDHGYITIKRIYNSSVVEGHDAVGGSIKTVYEGLPISIEIE